MIKKIIPIILLSLSSRVNTSFPISLQDIKKIGMQIWMNEASQRKDLIVFWNQHERFPSLGIGHNIWFPEGLNAPYTQGFPLLCDYLEKHGVQLPLWLKNALPYGAPWKTRDEFMQDHERTEELRDLLLSTIDLQTSFMIERLEQQFSLMIETGLPEQKDQLLTQYELLVSSLLGIYALVDYLNFKGDGLNPNEVSKGQHWGLKQVLLDMPNETDINNATKAFAVSAAKKLLMLIQNSAPDYKLVKFLHGWMKRISTYADPSIFN